MSQAENALRPLTPYEAKILELMDTREYTRCHGRAISGAKTREAREEAITQMVERYEDWASD